MISIGVVRHRLYNKGMASDRLSAIDNKVTAGPNPVELSGTSSANSTSEEIKLEKGSQGGEETENAIVEFLTGWKLHSVTLA